MLHVEQGVDAIANEEGKEGPAKVLESQLGGGGGEEEETWIKKMSDINSTLHTTPLPVASPAPPPPPPPERTMSYSLVEEV